MFRLITRPHGPQYSSHHNGPFPHLREFAAMGTMATPGPGQTVMVPSLHPVQPRRSFQGPASPNARSVFPPFILSYFCLGYPRRLVWADFDPLQVVPLTFPTPPAFLRFQNPFTALQANVRGVKGEFCKVQTLPFPTFLPYFSPPFLPGLSN